VAGVHTAIIGAYNPGPALHALHASLHQLQLPVSYLSYMYAAMPTSLHGVGIQGSLTRLPDISMYSVTVSDELA